MLEKSLSKYSLKLEKPIIWEDIRREVKFEQSYLGKDIKIYYEKLSGEIGKPFEGHQVDKDATMNTRKCGISDYINVNNVFEFLNDQSKIYKETIKLNIDKPIKVRDFYSKKIEYRNKYGGGIKYILMYEKNKTFFLIECRPPYYEGGRKLFAEAFNNYFNIKIPPEEFSWGGFQFMEATLSKKKINKLARKVRDKPKKIKVEEYLDIMIRYLIKNQSLFVEKS